MKNFTSLIILTCLFIYSLMPARVWAQTPIDLPCAYEDPCIIIGYESVVPISGTNDLLITMSYQIGCTTVTSVSITPVKGGNVQITPGDFELNQVNIIEFEVNSNTFYKNNEDQDSRLRIHIQFSDRPNVHVDLEFTSEEECGIINPLPVELTEFKGKTTESGINLEWETASELNNSHFDVERSADGNQFESIGSVQGRGTTSTPANYTLDDKAPLKGTNYYRLKQVDLDNAYSYSKTIAVKWDAGDEMKVALVPNPCLNGDCKIALSNAANTETLVQLKDMAGRVVYSKTVKGNSHLLELPLHDLKQYKGLYFLSAATGNKVVHQRIVLE